MLTLFVMKLKEALKKFEFLKTLALEDEVLKKCANHLARTLKGHEEKYLTPLAKNSDPIHVLVEWDEIFTQNSNKMNVSLLDLEFGNRSKFGPRSIAEPWSVRTDGLRTSYNCQNANHIPKFSSIHGNANLCPISLNQAFKASKGVSSSGLPYLSLKSKAIDDLKANFDDKVERQDPCMLFTRTTENRKTRNVWGYPFADTVYELMYYIPLLRYMKKQPYRPSLLGPDFVDIRITELVHHAMLNNMVLYSVDFAGFDASILYQYIVKAFDFIKSCYDPLFHPFLDKVCHRMHSIGIVTPDGILSGNHGVPSGSTFTNEVDSIIQIGIATTCSFIKAPLCIVQGDDGLYLLLTKDIPEFEAAFKYAGLRLEKSKSMIATNCAVFCQSLYHIDYERNGTIGGIYPTYRALNRLLFMERFVELGKHGIESKDYFGIRALTILENCKFHPLFEDLVRFVLAKETRFSLEVSDEGIATYVKCFSKSDDADANINHQYGSKVSGIRNFACYILIQQILAEEREALQSVYMGNLADLYFLHVLNELQAGHVV